MTHKSSHVLLLFFTFICFASSKIYDRCELAKELKYVHGFEPGDIATWVCITKHESHFNTSARNPGSGDHGLFQISQEYWCSVSGSGFACNAPCAKFRDDDIADDVKCVKKIFKEHQRISGNGFNAWAVYPLHCRGNVSTYISDCFDKEIDNTINTIEQKEPVDPVDEDGDGYNFPPLPNYSKVYDRCELAQELRNVHGIPEEQISTWVCIAQHESNFVTSAMNSGSGDHGLFQISDQYWCSLNGVGNGCNAKCSSFRDTNISDDVRCIKTIYNEHTRISGDGFNAWVVYPRYCKGDTRQYVDGCFEKEVKGLVYKPPLFGTPRRYEGNLVVHESKPKIYNRCELVQEMRNVYRFPNEQISKWVCIAEHESNFDTSAMNFGSGNHGLFQISEQYWCSLEGRGKGCNAQCSSFRDTDISDDIECIKIIYNEHTRISGNGFNTWAVYPRHCKGDTSNYIQGCLDTEVITVGPAKKMEENLIENFNKPKIYDRCELAKELRNFYGFPELHISTWICIVQHESNFDTSAMNPGSGDHGLFQISEQYWCSVASVGKGCNAHCSSFRDSNIFDDIECVRTIFNEHTAISGDGFNAWVVYPRYCKGDTSAYINGCFEAEFGNDIYEPSFNAINKFGSNLVAGNYPESSVLHLSTVQAVHQQQITEHSKPTTTEKYAYQYQTINKSSPSLNLIQIDSKITTLATTSFQNPHSTSKSTTAHLSVIPLPSLSTQKAGGNYSESSTLHSSERKTYQQQTTEKYTDQYSVRNKSSSSFDPTLSNSKITIPISTSTPKPKSSSKLILTTARSATASIPTPKILFKTTSNYFAHSTVQPSTKKAVYQPQTTEKYSALNKSSSLLSLTTTSSKIATSVLTYTQRPYPARKLILTNDHSIVPPLSSISARKDAFTHPGNSILQPSTRKTKHQQQTAEKYTYQYAGLNKSTIPVSISTQKSYSTPKSTLATSYSTVTSPPLTSTQKYRFKFGDYIKSSTVQSTTERRLYQPPITKELNLATTKKDTYQYLTTKKSSYLLNLRSGEFKLTTPSSVSTQNPFSVTKSLLTRTQSTVSPLPSATARTFTSKDVHPIKSQFSFSPLKSTPIIHSSSTSLPSVFTKSSTERPTTKIYSPTSAKLAPTSKDFSSSYQIFNIFKLFSTVKPILPNSISDQDGSSNKKYFSKSLIKDDVPSDTSKTNSLSLSLEASKKMHSIPTEEPSLIRSAKPLRQRPTRPTKFRPTRPGNIYGMNAHRPLPPGPARPVVTFTPSSTSQPVATSVYSTTSAYQKVRDAKSTLKPSTNIVIQPTTSKPVGFKSSFTDNNSLHQEIFNNLTVRYTSKNDEENSKASITPSANEKTFSTSQQTSTHSTISTYPQENIFTTTTGNINQQHLSYTKESTLNSLPPKPWSKPLGPRPIVQGLFQNISKHVQGIARPQSVQNAYRPVSPLQRPSKPNVPSQPIVTSVYSTTPPSLNGPQRPRPRPPFFGNFTHRFTPRPNPPRPFVTFRPTSTSQPVATSVYVTTPKAPYEKNATKLDNNSTLAFINSRISKESKTEDKLLNIFPGYSFARRGPVFLSFPHLLYTDEEYTNTLIGMSPEPVKHETYVTLEPNSGFPLDLAQRVQFNMFLRPIDGFDLMENITSALIPLMWVEESTTLGDKFVDMLKSKLINNLQIASIVKWVVIGSGAAAIHLAIFLLVYVEEP